jgi:hypothetical protein
VPSDEEKTDFPSIPDPRRLSLGIDFAQITNLRCCLAYKPSAVNLAPTINLATTITAKIAKKTSSAILAKSAESPGSREDLFACLFIFHSFPLLVNRPGL